jgi:hypothetical protein
VSRLSRARWIANELGVFDEMAELGLKAVPIEARAPDAEVEASATEIGADEPDEPLGGAPHSLWTVRLPLFCREVRGLPPPGQPTQAAPEGKREFVGSIGTYEQGPFFLQLLDRREIRPLPGAPEIAVQPLDLFDQDQDRSAGRANLLARIAG